MYLVLENHYSYSLVLSDDGRFLRVANLGYKVGEKTDRVYILEEETTRTPSEPKKKSPKIKRLYGPILALAACLVIAFVGIFSSDTFAPEAYGTVYMSINPKLSIDLKKDDRVISLEGLNEDGKVLASSIDYEDKKITDLIDCIYERASELGFLDSGRVYIKIDGKDESWEDELMGLVKDRLIEKDLSIRIDIENNNHKERIEPKEKGSPKKTIKIPVETKSKPDKKENSTNTPPTSKDSPVSYDESAYGDDSSYGTYQSEKPQGSADQSPYEPDTTNYDSPYKADTYEESYDESAYDSGSAYDDSSDYD